MKFIKSPQEMAGNSKTIPMSNRESHCERFNLAQYRDYHIRGQPYNEDS